MACEMSAVFRSSLSRRRTRKRSIRLYGLWAQVHHQVLGDKRCSVKTASGELIKLGETNNDCLSRSNINCRTSATLAHRLLSRRNYCATRNADGRFVLRGDDEI